MDIEIIEYLKTSVSPETADVYEKSFDLLSRFNVEDYIQPFDQIYMQVDDYDLTYILEQFDTAIMTVLNSLLNQHGIFITEEASHTLLNEILEGILNIENYDDCDGVLTILDTDYPDEEKLAEILTLVTATDAETIMTCLERINPGLLRTISALFNGRKQLADSMSQTEGSLIKAKAEWVKRLYSLKSVEFRDCKESKLFPKLEEGLRFNMEFQFYCNLLWDEIAHLNNADIARDLVGMAIISNDKSEKVLEIIKEYIGTYFSDLDQIGRVIDLSTRQFLVSKQDNGIAII